MTEKKKIVGFRADEKDLERIEYIKNSFDMPELISTAMVLKLALKVYADELKSGKENEHGENV